MQPVNRQLAAIMFTDIAGYTAMMQENEPAARALRERQRDVLEEYIPRHNGKILQTFGDGTLSVFNSAIDAVNCAVMLQLELQTGKAVPLRVGIHIGDVTYDDRDIYGDGVNVASRIESISTAGAVLVSDKVYDEIKNQPSLPSVLFGRFEFKNVTRPIDVYAVTSSGLVVPESTPQDGKLKAKKEIIAVLPFANMSIDPDNEYFSDGISEEILNALTRVEGLQVVARTSSFSFKGKNEDMREIGKKLNATCIIEGSVRKAGSRVRITAQLINAADGVHYWSEVYDRELKDIFEIQDEISLDIAHKLQQQFANIHTPEHLVRSSTKSIDAYDIYLRINYMLNHNPTYETNKQAIRSLEEAVKLDPGFAKAYSMLASSYMVLGTWNIMPPEEAFVKAKQCINKALELDEKEYMAYIASCEYKRYYERDWEGTKEMALNAIKFNPDSADAYLELAIYYRRFDLNEAILCAQKAAELDPLSINILNLLANIYVEARSYDDAYKIFQKALIVNPKGRLTRYQFAFFYVEKGDFLEAKRLVDEWSTSREIWEEDSALRASIYMNTGEQEKAFAILERLKKKIGSGDETPFLWDLAVFNAILGNLDEAMEYLYKADSIRLGSLVVLKASTSFKNLRSDERFKSLLKKLGLIVE
jgi:adenylate cyclase